MSETKKTQETNEILDYAYAAVERLRNGEMVIEEVREVNKYVHSVAKFIQLRIEWAKLSGRIAKGSDTVPDMKF